MGFYTGCHKITYYTIYSLCIGNAYVVGTFVFEILYVKKICRLTEKQLSPIKAWFSFLCWEDSRKSINKHKYNILKITFFYKQNVT